MKPKRLPTLLTFVALAGPLHASTLLLTDNFDSGSYGASTFNDTLGTDQGGTLATVNYTVTNNFGGDWAAQHGNGAAMLLVGDNGWGSTASLNHNFAANASGPLSISFDARWATAPPDGGHWFSFTVGSLQNTYANFGGVGYGVLFTKNGSTQQWQNGTNIGSTGENTWSSNTSVYQNVTITLSDGNGGSAFTGNGSVVDLYSGATLISSLTLGTDLTSSDGYMTFAVGPYNGAYAIANFDNLSVSVVPEPAAALLGGLGMLGLLRRRRSY